MKVCIYIYTYTHIAHHQGDSLIPHYGNSGLNKPGLHGMGLKVGPENNDPTVRYM